MTTEYSRRRKDDPAAKVCATYAPRQEDNLVECSGLRKESAYLQTAVDALIAPRADNSKRDWITAGSRIYLRAPRKR